MNDNDDPFADFDDGQRTIIAKPQPGGRLGPPGGRSDAVLPPATAVDLPDRQGLNRLETAAARLLNLLTGLKNTHSHPDAAGLHRHLIGEIQAFERAARELGVSDPLTLTRARYVLCATLDDVALNTPWGQDFGWSKRTLQGTFFKKEWAGDEFFQLLDRLLQDPVQNRELLELMYICLALGFKGGYRVYDRQDELESRREQVYRALRNLGEEFEPTLSPHWRGLRDTRNVIIRYVPLWVLAAGCALLLLLIYLFFYWRLVGVASPVFADLLESGRDTRVAAAPTLVLPERRTEDGVQPPPPPPPPPSGPSNQEIHQALQQALRAEPCLRTGNVAFGNQTEIIGTYIRTSPDCGALFDSGKWDIKPEFRAQLLRIAGALRSALEEAPGWLVITGHTDNVPGRYITNAELSQKRADAALAVLREPLGNPSKIRAEGRGEHEPLKDADNATAEGRARNRRVEVMLLFPHVSL